MAKTWHKTNQATVRGKDKSRIMAGMLLASAMGCGSGCDHPPKTSPEAPPGAAQIPAQVREPAVAGVFYPGTEAQLSATLDRLLKHAPQTDLPRLRALICPHAGYEYSGPTAACGYRTLSGRDFQTVVILGPSHFAMFEGASLPNVEAYRTPLGVALISDQVKLLAGTPPFVVEPRCPVQRPPWWRQAKKSVSDGEDTPDTWEHSLEVQVPFLQKVLPQAKILPVVFGEVEPEAVARGLAKILDDRTVIVASSDLSHYHLYDVAKDLDASCIRAILNLDLGALHGEEACGKVPIMALLQLAREKGWKTRLLDARNSGDATGDHGHVVGYAAIAFYEPAEGFPAEQKKMLLALARAALARAAAGESPPEIKTADLPARLSEPGACFVTLRMDGALRGCIGQIRPQLPLVRAVAAMARDAALHDARFAPVHAEEAAKISIEISVLTQPQPVLFRTPEELLDRLQPFADGVMLQIGSAGATFLPQVWEQIPDKIEFLNRLAEKAGCAPTAWRGRDVSVSVYHVTAFSESE